MLTRPEAKGKVLRAVNPNIGIEVEYRHRLQALLESMHHSVRYWLESAYRNNQPVLAQDSPASVLKGVFDRVARRWRKTWNEMAGKLARYFSRQVQERLDASLRRDLRDNGITADFTITEAMRDVLHATIAQNVSLIKSIPHKYLLDVEQSVMRSVQTGGDIEELTRELENKFSIAHRRASVIAHTQNEMATASMARVRLIELGFDAEWVYTWRSKEPRKTHIKMHGQRFSPKVGLWDSHERQMVTPGSLINCKCRSRPALPM